MRRKYYLAWIRMRQRNIYVIWSSADEGGEESVFRNDFGEDRLLLDDTDLLKHFPDVETAKQFALAAGIRIVDERLVPHDLDRLQRFITNADESAVPSIECLDAWNLYVDLAESVAPKDVGFLEVVEDNFDIYDKLFDSTDIPAHHKALTVSWTSDELARLRRVLSLGEKALTSRLQRREDISRSTGESTS